MKEDCKNCDVYHLSCSICESTDIAGWININNQTPNDGQEVLTYFKLTGIELARYKKLKGTKEEVFGQNMFYNKSGYLTDDVTHWMPLPEVP